MDKIHYVGEHLLGGKIGYIFVFIAFAASLLTIISYFYATQKKELSEKASWRGLGRFFYRLHSVAVIGIAATLFIIIFNHRFEYYYVWEHSSLKLPVRYILACFWGGQEGSFLLWMFWDVVLGNILIFTAKEWENPVMVIIALAQAFLTSMILGIYVLGIHIGSSPFILLREHPDMLNLPFVHDANYLQSIHGKGLNPLLQNYWMLIHPPTLFLGFALTVVPFAYAIAGIWKGKYREWIKPALPWAFVCIMILGTGVLMGGAWAYETLSFGGFWAWDPVENSSLVPWLIMVGAAHLMLVNINKDKSLFATYFFTTLSFILVLYASYLTRSGILGDTSVHSFTDSGLAIQLIIFLVFFAVGTALILATYYKKIPSSKEETLLYSREFWMFIGAVVLVLSTLQILSTTSIPVYNALFGTHIAPPVHPKMHYNKWQVPFATVVTILVGFGQYLKYKNTDKKDFYKKLSFSIIIALALTILSIFFLKFDRLVHYFLFFAATFCVVANFDYMLRVFKGNIKKSGASIAHIGFGLIILGALLTNGKKKIISANTSGVQFNMKGKTAAEANNNNIMLVQGDTLPMGNYFITYTGVHKEGFDLLYNVKYYKKVGNKYVYQFELNPVVQLNKQMGNVAKPSTKHFLTYDIYSHITYANLDGFSTHNNSKYTKPETQELSPGDTLFTSSAMAKIEYLTKTPNLRGIAKKDSDIALGAELTVSDFRGHRESAEPFMLIRENHIFYYPDTLKDMGIILSLRNINPKNGKLEMSYRELKTNQGHFIIMQAMVFPYVNILWLGCVIMVIGIFISIVERIKKQRVVEVKKE